MFSFIQYNCMWVLVKFCTHRKFLNNQASSHLKDLVDRSQTAGLIVAEPSALRSFFCEISSQLGFGRQTPSKFLDFKLFGKVRARSGDPAAAIGSGCWQTSHDTLYSTFFLLLSPTVCFFSVPSSHSWSLPDGCQRLVGVSL